MCLIFVGQGYPRKLFNLEHFLIYGIQYSLPAAWNLNRHNCTLVDDEVALQSGPHLSMQYH